MKDVVPFLATLAAPKQVTPFGAALPVVETPRANSPWSPQAPAAPPVTAAPAIDVAAVRAEGIARGRDEGMRETAALRATLQTLIAKLAAAESEARAQRADLIADAATTVVRAWTQRAEAGEAFAPAVQAWLAKTTAPATALVNPADVDAMRAAIGDAEIAVVADAAVARGGVQLRSAAHEMIHTWDARLAELHDAIVTALEVKP